MRCLHAQVVPSACGTSVWRSPGRASALPRLRSALRSDWPVLLGPESCRRTRQPRFANACDTRGESVYEALRADPEPALLVAEEARCHWSPERPFLNEWEVACRQTVGGAMPRQGVRKFEKSRASTYETHPTRRKVACPSLRELDVKTQEHHVAESRRRLATHFWPSTRRSQLPSPQWVEDRALQHRHVMEAGSSAVIARMVQRELAAGDRERRLPAAIACSGALIACASSRRDVGQHRVDEPDRRAPARRRRGRRCRPVLARDAGRHQIFIRRCSTPRSAIMPMWISCTVKNASSEQTRMSHAVARSSAPPMQPPWIAQITGRRASSSALKQSISLRSESWKLSRAHCAVWRWRGIARRRSRTRRATCRRRSACRSMQDHEHSAPRRRNCPATGRTASRSAGKNGERHRVQALGPVHAVADGRCRCRASQG